jgi:hypothetical protein
MTDRLRFDLSGLSRVCVVMLGLMVLAELLFAADSWGVLSFLDAVEAGTLVGAELDAEAQQMEFRGMLVGLGYLALFVLTSVMSGIWIYRASWNARQIQPYEARISPGWALGWFFIPIMSLWKPYQAMAQTWNSSHVPTGDPKASMPSFVQAWWLLWVATSLAGNLSFRLSRRAETLEDFRTVTNLDLATAPFAILTAVLFMKVIKSITAAQRDKHPLPLQEETRPAQEGDQP